MWKKPIILLIVGVFFMFIMGGCGGDLQNQKIPDNKTAKFPEKPITLIVGFSVGSGSDLVARSLEKVAQSILANR